MEIKTALASCIGQQLPLILLSISSSVHTNSFVFHPQSLSHDVLFARYFFMFLSIFCAVLGCILFASGQYLGDLIPWDRMYMDNVWPHYTPDPTTGIEPNFFSLLALFYPSVTGKFDKLHCREISFGISLIILIT